jgi:cystathionine beta-lyase/cystathionine gamma-synthase
VAGAARGHPCGLRIGRGLIRLSAGIEDPADVLADLDRTLDAVDAL